MPGLVINLDHARCGLRAYSDRQGDRWPKLWPTRPQWTRFGTSCGPVSQILAQNARHSPQHSPSDPHPAIRRRYVRGCLSSFA